LGKSNTSNPPHVCRRRNYQRPSFNNDRHSLSGAHSDDLSSEIKLTFVDITLLCRFVLATSTGE
jgi:hypothetical protein